MIRDIREIDEYPRLLSRAKPKEKCLPCALCAPVCPTKAIKVDFRGTREDAGPLREGVEGSISIDLDRCNLCGRCVKYCPAFLLIEKDEIDPRDLKPYDQILVDEELCDYCGLCAKICPEEAIKVEGTAIEEEPHFEGTVSVDEELCIGCGRCALICPYEGIDVQRPFEGEIRLRPKNVPKCDPSGCHGCFNVCPAKCWYVDEDGKIALAKDQCIFCGACVGACPKDVMEVKRTGVRHTDFKDVPWASEWRDAIESIVTGEKSRPDVSLAVSPPAIERPPPPKVEPIVRDPELARLVCEALAPVAPALRKPKVRFIMEREPPETASDKIVERLLKDKKKAAEAVKEG